MHGKNEEQIIEGETFQTEKEKFLDTVRQGIGKTHDSKYSPEYLEQFINLGITRK